MRVEQERIRLLARLEELMAQQDLVYPSVFRPIQAQLTWINSQDNLSGSSVDEHATSPPSSSASTKIGSASVDKPSAKRRQLDAVVVPTNEKRYKAPAPRKSIGKPPTGATKIQIKPGTAKDKGTPKQRQNPEGSATKGPTQKVIRRVHATVEVPVKVEEDEDEFVRTPVNDMKGKPPPGRDPKSSRTVKKTIKSAEPTRTKNWQAHKDDDVTPPALAQVPKRRKSGVDKDYHEPDGVYSWQSPEDANVRHRPPSRRKSIRELRESDFEYHEEEEEGEETDADELNLGVGPLFDNLLANI